MKLHSCYILSPLTRAPKHLEERRDTVDCTRGQVEEGGEEPSSQSRFLTQHFEFGNRTGPLWSPLWWQGSGSAPLTPRAEARLHFQGKWAWWCSVSVTCPETSLSRSISGAVEAVWGQSSTERDVARGSHSFWVKKHELFHGRGKLRASVLRKLWHKLLQPVPLRSFTLPHFSW